MQEAIYTSIHGKWNSFQSMFTQLEAYIAEEPMCRYRISIGTDSQVHAQTTRFVTGIVVQRIHLGTWACLTKRIVAEKMLNLYERLSYETALTEQVLILFTQARKEQLLNLINSQLGEEALLFEAHLDLGSQLENRSYVYADEMIKRVERFGFVGKLKPDSFVASSYANRFTK
ncbi:putative RNase H-related nuclease YkuK (DUF458 family) [Alkalihalobacillus xiaoxiensis]|uniref:RNase H-related nuclease YkuK (DUF458 family) n=1 Tax=Shouchella xiaoxiensis TaxID=766895 RepID=A0ABS2SY08_9BACI|nr:ribonuclease H-like YkuK family protein [Shouchella xiaoxiensis]MBM7839319.1 putative RNase H-related nuclease YkuK (DUF458 family) [Shouchella xiaoxiensis]